MIPPGKVNDGWSAALAAAMGSLVHPGLVHASTATTTGPCFLVMEFV